MNCGNCGNDNVKGSEFCSSCGSNLKPVAGTNQNYQAPLPPYTPRGKLYRSRNDRWIGGVAGGLGENLGIDPNLVRIIWIVMAFTGAGFIGYLVAWLIIPENPLLGPGDGTQ